MLLSRQKFLRLTTDMGFFDPRTIFSSIITALKDQLVWSVPLSLAAHEAELHHTSYCYIRCRWPWFKTFLPWSKFWAVFCNFQYFPKKWSYKKLCNRKQYGNIFFYYWKYWIDFIPFHHHFLFSLFIALYTLDLINFYPLITSYNFFEFFIPLFIGWCIRVLLVHLLWRHIFCNY